MFSPVKTITAGALILAMGGVLLIAQPFGQQGDIAPGVGTDAAPAAPVEFTGRFLVGQGCASGGEITELPGDIKRVVGAPCRPASLETTDPRLNGEVTMVMNYDFHRAAVDGSTPAATLRHQLITIETADGVWRSRPILLFAAANGRPSGTTSVFVGESGYQGLTAFAEMMIEEGRDGRDIRGFIIDGEIPAEPEPLD